MTIRVLVVDDSGFFRRRIVEVLGADPDIEVVATAANGQEAINQVILFKPDVVTMDVEMPIMDGITAVRRIMSSRPTPVLMFSSSTHEGARATLDALDAGAVDFLPKRFEDIARNRDEAKTVLCDRVRAVSRQRSTARIPGSASVKSAAVQTATKLPKGTFNIVVIASSTGGPVAIQQVLSSLPASFPYPVLVVQHMPASFTPAFSARLNEQCDIKVAEAKAGDALKPGQVLIAPGGRQMTVQQKNGGVHIEISDAGPEMHYKPCVDMTFSSVASVYAGKALAIVLTGMGADGREGARELKEKGSIVWSQDEASSVIYGMPMAVVEAGLSDLVLPLNDIGPSLIQTVSS